MSNFVLWFHDAFFFHIWQVINHPDHQDTRCFSVVRKDGTVEDFSYHKCAHSALEIIAPGKAKIYHERYLQSRAL